MTLEAYSTGGAEAGGLPFTAARIKSGDASVLAAPAPGSKTATTYGLVPDGVASVSVTLNEGAPTSASVANNFSLAVLPPPAPPANGEFTVTQQWYAADGSLLKTVKQTRAVRTVTFHTG